VVQITLLFSISQGCSTRGWQGPVQALADGAGLVFSEYSSRRGGENNLKGELQKSRSLLPICSSFAPPDKRNKTSPCLRYAPPQLHPSGFSQHQPTCGAPPSQSFSMGAFSFSLEYALWRKLVKAGITQGYIWLSVSGMLFLQSPQKLSIQLPCFCLEGSIHLH